VLGPTTAKRTAKTTVVARDQQTVVIGGIMQERAIESVKKVPILGDIPSWGTVPHAEPREDQDEPAAVPDPVHHQGLDRLPPHLRAQDERAAAVRRDVLRPADRLRRGDRLLAQGGAALAHDADLEPRASKFENGGPGQVGEKLIAPSKFGWTDTPVPSSQPQPPLPPAPAPTPVTPPITPPVIEAPPGAQPAPVQPPIERLQVQPEIK